MRGLNTYRYDRCQQCGVPTMRDVSDDKQMDHMMANVYTDMDPQRWRVSAMTSRWILMMTDACSLPVISAPPACRQLILTVHSQQTCWPNSTYKICSAGVAERQHSKKEKKWSGGYIHCWAMMYKFRNSFNLLTTIYSAWNGHFSGVRDIFYFPLSLISGFTSRV